MGLREECAARLEQLLGEIDDTCRSVERSANDLTIIAVTKFHSAELVRTLSELGLRNFGESRHNEAMLKAQKLDELSLTWHFVGQLQSNKAAAAARYVDVLHSLDRESLVKSLGVESRNENPLSCFIQVNLSEDPKRGGVQPLELGRFADSIAGRSGLRILGLMTVAPLEGDPRRAFAKLRVLGESLSDTIPGANALSMGMSSDFREAIEEGATHLRIGTAITGIRPLTA